ncbi:MAG: response regulator [Alphaproteobacteria bacterium]|nr:MAG: response regulator [Alphaproteobacteria bacterium]
MLDTSIDEGPVSGMRVLAVDDDEFIRTLLTEILRVAGNVDVAVAGGGEEALEILRSSERPFDAMIFDIQMPGMDGIALCRAVREMAGYAKTPIYMLSAMTEKEYVERASSAGASGYLTKPFDPMELIARVCASDHEKT